VSDTAVAVRPEWVAPRRSEACAPVALPAADAPIFLDTTGHRARVVRMLGRLTIGLGAAWAAGVIAGATGITPLPAAGSPLASRPAAPSVVAGPAQSRGRALVAQSVRPGSNDPLGPAALVADREHS
jgi:hypothetical protein